MSQQTFDMICELLDKNDICYKILSHPPIVSAVEAAKVRNSSLDRCAKALILRSEGKFFQFIIPGDRKLDFKKAKAAIGSKSLSLASHDEVLKLTDCSVGSVPPFGVLWNIPVHADINLADIFDFSAGLHDKSITISRKDWEKVVCHVFADLSAK